MSSNILLKDIVDDGFYYMNLVKEYIKILKRDIDRDDYKITKLRLEIA